MRNQEQRGFYEAMGYGRAREIFDRSIASKFSGLQETHLIEIMKKIYLHEDIDSYILVYPHLDQAGKMQIIDYLTGEITELPENIYQMILLKLGEGIDKAAGVLKEDARKSARREILLNWFPERVASILRPLLRGIDRMGL